MKLHMNKKLCAAILGGLAAGLFLRRLATRGGATDDEVDASLVGDDVIPHPMVETTHAITIAVPPAAVWPWIIQGGYRGAGRAGWYSDSWFNWLVEGGFLRVTVPPESMHEKPGVASADEILPAFQHTAVGDIVPDGPPGSAQFEVRAADPARAWVLYSDTHIKYLTPTTLHSTRWASHGEFTWVFVLQPIGEQGTRLILRTRARFGPRLLRPLFLPLFYLGEAIIPRMTLRGVKSRAERTTRTSSLEFNDDNKSIPDNSR
jgi:hypothetical protein